MKRKVSNITKDLIALEEKRNALIDLRLQLLECSEQACKIALRGSSKYPAVTLKRMFRVLGWAMKANMIKKHIDIVNAQPIFPQGGLPIVGEELIINKER